MIGLDTTAIIDIFKGDKRLRKFLENNTEPLSSTIMNYMELFFGLNPKDSKPAKESEYYRTFF
jgi:predicted nucleic acid-binding protein